MSDCPKSSVALKGNAGSYLTADHPLHPRQRGTFLYTTAHQGTTLRGWTLALKLYLYTSGVLGNCLGFGASDLGFEYLTTPYTPASGGHFSTQPRTRERLERLDIGPELYLYTSGVLGNCLGFGASDLGFEYLTTPYTPASGGHFSTQPRSRERLEAVGHWP